MSIDSLKVGELPFAFVKRLEEAEASLEEEIRDEMTYRTPKAYFELAHMKLLRGEDEGFLANINQGTMYCADADQPAEFALMLSRMLEGGFHAPVIEKGLAQLDSIVGKLRLK